MNGEPIHPSAATGGAWFFRLLLDVAALSHPGLARERVADRRELHQEHAQADPDGVRRAWHEGQLCTTRATPCVGQTVSLSALGITRGDLCTSQWPRPGGGAAAVGDVDPGSAARFDPC